MENPSFPGFDGLNHLSLRSGVDMRPTLLRVLTDLYVQKIAHTADEERHYTELALRLLEAVDVPTRVAVARRLVRHLSPPLEVMRYLARDLPEIAAPVQSHPLMHAPPPAEAAELTRVAVSPAVEGDAPEEEEDQRADAAPELDPATAAELNDLFFAANPDERRLILLNLDVVAPLPSTPDGILRDPSVGGRLEAAALAHGREDFVQQLAHALRISREQARRVARDDLGEPVVVAAKALGIPRDMIYRILMFLNPVVGQSVERVHALAALYDEVTPRAAEGMVAIWHALPVERRTGVRHQRLTWDDETGPRARPASAMQHAPAVPATKERRTAS